MEKGKLFIVKMQTPLFVSPGSPREVLIYNEDRSYYASAPCTPETDKLIGEGHKKFFWVWLDEKQQTQIDREAPWQDW